MPPLKTCLPVQTGPRRLILWSSNNSKYYFNISVPENLERTPSITHTHTQTHKSFCRHQNWRVDSDTLSGIFHDTQTTYLNSNIFSGPDSVGWSVIPQYKRKPIQFPVRAPAWVVGLVFGGGAYGRHPIDDSLSHPCFSPSLSSSLPLSLKINT